MNPVVTGLSVLLVIGACSPRPPAIQQPQPQPRELLPTDTALARIQSDSALGHIVDSLGLAARRWVCPMPVWRGDSSKDGRMVMPLLPFDPMPGVHRYCYNPLFRDSSRLSPNRGMKGRARALYFITGSPGAGKTTLLRRVVADYYPRLWTGHVERRRRLLEDRRQPELDHRDVYCWASYLRGQADALDLEVLDTTGRDVANSAAELAQSIGRFAERAGVKAAL